MHKDYYVSINCNGLGLHCLFQETNPQLLLTKLQACFITHIKEKELKGTDHRTFSKSQLLTNYTYRNLMHLSLISSFQNKKKRERRKRRKGREKKNSFLGPCSSNSFHFTWIKIVIIQTFYRKTLYLKHESAVLTWLNNACLRQINFLYFQAVF